MNLTRVLLTIGLCAFAAPGQQDTIPRFEIRGFGGMNYAPGRSPMFDPRTPPSYGAQAAVFLKGTTAAIGTFAYNQGGADFSVPGSGSSIKELMGGMRLSFPLGDLPVTPYGSLSAGKVSFTQWSPPTIDELGVAHAVSKTVPKAGVAPAIGADISFSRSLGFGVELRTVKAEGAGLYYRLCGSVYYRFP